MVQLNTITRSMVEIEPLFCGQQPKFYDHCINSGDQATINWMKKFPSNDKKFPSGNQRILVAWFGKWTLDD